MIKDKLNVKLKGTKMKIKEKTNGNLVFVEIGDVSFVMFKEDWETVKSRIQNKELFSFRTLSRKRIDIIKNERTGKLEIVDTYLKKFAYLEE